MPIYEYRCSSCQREFELRRSFSEVDSPAACPTCGSPGQRLLSVFGAKNGMYVKPSGRTAFRGGKEA